MSTNKEDILQVMCFIANKVQINDLTVKDTYQKICSLFDGNIPDDSKVTIRNEQNQDTEISINEHPDFLVYRFYEAIEGKKLNLFDSVVEVNTSIIHKEGLSENLLLTLIAAELQLLINYLNRALTESSNEKVNDFFAIRIDYLIKYIAENEVLDSIDRTPLGNLIELMNFQINTAIRRSDINDKFTLLKDYLSREVNSEFKRNVLYRYIDISKGYMLNSEEEMINIFNENSALFNIEEQEMIMNEISSDPANVVIHSFQQGGGSTIKKTNDLITAIGFICSRKIVNNDFDKLFTLHSMSNKKLIGKRLLSYLDDSIVNGLNIGGLKAQYISDFTGLKDNDNVEFKLQIDDFVHPHFDMDGDKILEKDFERKERLDGRQYHPIKKIAIEFLLDVKYKLHEVFEIPDSDFNINLFSNYSIEYFDKKTKELLYRKIYLFTNPGAYVSSRKDYFNSLSQFSLSSTFLRVRQLMDNTKIVTQKGLQQFILKLLKFFIKDAVELSGNYKYFWTLDNGNRIPQKEVEMQPLILNQLRFWLEYKGINISKEPEYSNGKLDFECSFNSDSKLFKCAIEIKNAHHSRILDGVSKQLPQYMRQTGKYGIFCFLWYKGNQFDEPRKYSTLEELKDQLINEIPKEFNIEVLGINCNKGPTPSTL